MGPPPPAGEGVFVTTAPNPSEPLFADEHCGPQDGPMAINVDVTRYAGTTNADGTLVHLPVMIQNGLAKPTCKLTIMLWGRRVGAQGCAGLGSLNDLVRIKVNGTALHGAIQGLLSNGEWTEVHVEVPTELIRFRLCRGCLSFQLRPPPTPRRWASHLKQLQTK